MTASSLPVERTGENSVITAVCQVVFDIDFGQRLEYIYPAESLSAQEESDVAFHSFPDSMSMELRSKTSVRDCCFFFCIRRQSSLPNTLQQYLYGFVFCRQRQDERLRRGGEQKSVVVLSPLPLTSLLVPLSRVLGPAALSYGSELLEKVYEEAARWPPLVWGASMTLPLGDLGAITAQLPELSTLPLGGDPLPLPCSSTAGQATPGGGPSPAQALASPSRPLPGLARAPGTPSLAATAASVGRGGVGGYGWAGAGEVKGTVSRAPTTPGGAEMGAATVGRVEDVWQGVLGAQCSVHSVVAGPSGPPLGMDWWLEELDSQTGLPLCLLPQACGQHEPLEGPFAEVDAFTHLRHVLPHLWTLWEIAVLGQPLLVVAPTPAATSSTVAALISLITPLPYAPDFRPYFTIHDPAFASLTSGTLPTPNNGLPRLLGTTNLYVVKALPAWPNVLSTGYAEWQQQAQQPGQGGGQEGGLEGGTAPGAGSGRNGKDGGGTGGVISQLLRRRHQTPQSLLSHPSDALWVNYKPLSKPDKELLSRLATCTPADPPSKQVRASALNTLLLRRHFQELTQALLFPLLPYISPAPPPAAPPSPSALAKPPALPPLNCQAVLANLADRGGTVPDILLKRFGGTKQLVQFYDRFLACTNVQSWLRTRRAVAERWQACVWQDAWWEAGGGLDQAAVPHTGEVEAVEEFFEVEQQLGRMQLRQEAAGEAEQAGGEGLALLRLRLSTLFASFPADLQESLLLNPQRAALVKSASNAPVPPRC